VRVGQHAHHVHRVVRQRLLRDHRDAIEHFTQVEHAGERMRQLFERVQVIFPGAQRGGAFPLVGHPLMRHGEGDVVGDAARHRIVVFRERGERRGAELQRSANPAVEPQRQANRRPQAASRRRPIALRLAGEQVVVQRELERLVEHRRVIGREHVRHDVARNPIEGEQRGVRVIVGENLNRHAVVRQHGPRDLRQPLEDLAHVERCRYQRRHRFDRVDARQPREPFGARLRRANCLDDARGQRPERRNRAVVETVGALRAGPEAAHAVAEWNGQQRVDAVLAHPLKHRMRGVGMRPRHIVHDDDAIDRRQDRRNQTFDRHEMRVDAGPPARDELGAVLGLGQDDAERLDVDDGADGGGEIRQHHHSRP
jgi:hypothetical protein